MNYLNCNCADEQVTFREATLMGMGRNKGLFVPEYIPRFSDSFFGNIEQLPDYELAFQVMQPYVSPCIHDADLRRIVSETLSFPLPVKQLDENLHLLELFHGPTMAFKDVGARFMARCLGLFTENSEKVTVLVATSGDTGSAVAQGFYEVRGVEVVILFPKGKISPFQEYQMTSLGKNIRAIAVEGTFDDCQTLIKQALDDSELNRTIRLSSANSINVARFLPQMLYYFMAYKQMKNMLQGAEWVISVPSGNFGNLTAGLYAQAMGMPVHRFVAANNQNDTFFHYLQTGDYQPKNSVSTYASAMDVGAPSNFVRVMQLFANDYDSVKKAIVGFRVSNEEILQEIFKVHSHYNYLLDPHGAVGMLALKHHLQKNQKGVVLGTAHPKKFDGVIRMVLPDFPSPKIPKEMHSKELIPNNYALFREILQMTRI